MTSTFRFDLAFAPGDSLCCDFYDPRRHLDADCNKLPSDLTRLLKHWVAERKLQNDPSTTSQALPAPSELSDETSSWSEESDWDGKSPASVPNGTERGDYITNIEGVPGFQAWVNQTAKSEATDAPDNEGRRNDIIQPEFMPHSLALGPDDMFCWISKSQFCFNDPFKAAFPELQRTLAKEQERKRLGEVRLVTSTYRPPGSSQPYFALATADGVCIASVPPATSDKFSRYAFHIGAVLRAKWTKRMSDLQTSYDDLTREAEAAIQVVISPQQTETREPNSSAEQEPAPQRSSKVTGTATGELSSSITALKHMRRTVQALLAIKEHCELNIVLSMHKDQMKSKDLDSRVDALLEESRTWAEDLQITANNLKVITTNQNNFIDGILGLIRAFQPVKPIAKPEANPSAEVTGQPNVEASEPLKPAVITVETKEEEGAGQSTTKSAKAESAEQPPVENQVVESPKEPTPIVQEGQTQPATTVDPKIQKSNKLDGVMEELRALLQHLKDAQSAFLKELTETIQNALEKPISAGVGEMKTTQQELNSLVKLLGSMRSEVIAAKKNLTAFDIVCDEKLPIGEGVNMLGQRYQEKVVALNAAAETLVEYIKDYDSTKTPLSDGIKKLLDELSTAKEDLKSAAGILRNTLTEVNTKLETSAEDAFDVATSLPSGISKLGEALISKDTQLKRAKTETSDSQAALNSAKATLTAAASGTYNPETSSLETGITALGEALRTATAEKTRLTGELEKLRNATGPVTPSGDSKPPLPPAVSAAISVWRSRVFVNETGRDAALAFHADFEEVKRFNPNIPDATWTDSKRQFDFYFPNKIQEKDVVTIKRILKLPNSDGSAAAKRSAESVAAYFHLDMSRFVGDNGTWVRKTDDLSGHVLAISAFGPYKWPQPPLPL
ncbi:hypothetical protein LTR84_005226 [Exophiala bonariae]|uniref:Uncharacterized protein n=1 Tax=Exophiala bonariae TaxID=1690606 RepID=A0AAV9NT61_9EURO|nr:hypothetical protein LTR84_005226 [Exophiala bonariae]